MALDPMAAHPTQRAAIDRQALMEQARRGEVVVIDVRPPGEYAVAHLPCVRSMRLAEIEKRLASLPRDKEIVAYCRGPFCLPSDKAAALLQAKSFRARKVSEGVSEWQAAGLPLAINTD